MIAALALIMLTQIAEASPQKATTGRDTALVRVRSILPKDWTVELTGLPAGVEAIALGPIGKDGRPVLIATTLADPNTVLDRESLEAKLGTKLLAFETRGVLGATEARTEVTNEGAVFVVLHLFGTPVAPYAISLIAPKSMFFSVYKTLAAAAERLASADKALSEKVGVRR